MSRNHEFTIIERHPESGPTLDERNADLADWFTKVLITKEYVKQPAAAESEKATA